LEPSRWGFDWQSMTEKCIEALVLAQREAEFLNDASVGTEHVLVGLLSSQNLGAQILAEHHIDVHVVRATLEKFRSREAASDVRRFSWRVRRAVELAFEEARSLRETFINTDHLYIGLLQQDDSTALKILLDLQGPVSEVLERLRKQHAAATPVESMPLFPSDLLDQLPVLDADPWTGDAPPEIQAPMAPPSLELDKFLEVLDELSRALLTAHKTVEDALPSAEEEPMALIISVPMVDDEWPVVDEETYQIGGLVRQILSSAVQRKAARVVLEPSPQALRVEYHLASGRCDAVEVPAILRYVVPFKVMRMAGLNPMEKGRELEGKLIFHYRGRSHRMRVLSEPVLKGLRVEVLTGL
jgi:type II secretory ATPase GspE/PulE/Tfp pilus assembly ATPase PilB-like protein